MRALVQRVRRARVSLADGELTLGEIGPGLLVLLGVGRGDDEHDVTRLAAKVRALRIFADSDGRMNEALGDRAVLCVSQFTLYADTGSGNRPSFKGAAAPDVAQPLYERFCELLDAQRGRFGAHMLIDSTGDGPVTLLLE